eukprot:2256500-Rhodomonas_salina.1
MRTERIEKERRRYHPRPRKGSEEEEEDEELAAEDRSHEATWSAHWTGSYGRSGCSFSCSQPSPRHDAERRTSSRRRPAGRSAPLRSSVPLGKIHDGGDAHCIAIARFPDAQTAGTGQGRCIAVF